MAEARLTHQDDVLDLVAWRHYGRTTGRVEAMLEDPTNYRLCDKPEVLLIGTLVVMPDVLESKHIPTVRLWD